MELHPQMMRSPRGIKLQRLGSCYVVPYMTWLEPQVLLHATSAHAVLMHMVGFKPVWLKAILGLLVTNVTSVVIIK